MIKSYQQSHGKNKVLGLLLVVVFPVVLISYAVYREQMGWEVAILLFIGCLLLLYRIEINHSSDLYLYDNYFVIKNKMKFWQNNEEIACRDLKKAEIHFGSRGEAYLHLFFQNGQKKRLGLLRLETEQIEELIALLEKKGVAAEFCKLRWISNSDSGKLGDKYKR